MKAWFYLIALVFTCLLLSLQLFEKPKAEPIKAAADEPFERQKQNWADFLAQLNGLQDAFAREPSRPLIHWRQEILKLHYLWLEVRDYAFVKYEAAKRSELDAHVARLVARVEAQKEASDQPATDP